MDGIDGDGGDPPHDDTPRKAPIGATVSIATQLVERRLRDLKIGGIAEWTELERLTGMPRSRIYQISTTAQNRLVKEGYHFLTSVGEGVERISHTDVVDRKMPKQRGAIRSAARKSLKTAQGNDLSQLDASRRATSIAQQTTSLYVLHGASERQVRMLADVIQKTATSLPLTPKEACRRYLESMSASGSDDGGQKPSDDVPFGKPVDGESQQGTST